MDGKVGMQSGLTAGHTPVFTGDALEPCDTMGWRDLKDLGETAPLGEAAPHPNSPSLLWTSSTDYKS